MAGHGRAWQGAGREDAGETGAKEAARGSGPAIIGASVEPAASSVGRKVGEGKVAAQMGGC